MSQQTVGARIAELFHAEQVEPIFSILDPGYSLVHARALELGDIHEHAGDTSAADAKTPDFSAHLEF
jgi:hypothetical protein